MVISQLNRKKIALHSIYFKIFVNYLQIIMIMVSFKLNWPDIVQDFLFYQESAGSVTGRIFTIECLMEEILSLDTYFSQLILFAILPFIILIICSMFWALKSLINKQWAYMRNELVASIIIVMFLFHPQILRYMMSAFSC